jgi:transcription initiation factor TFIIIB Brf1 subunit/transcription initiation factor TFIIB
MCDIQASWDLFDSMRVSEEAIPLPFDEYHCSACGGQKRFQEGDDLPVCTECGRTDAVFISEEAEWRSGPDDNGTGGGDPSRVGAPINTDHFSTAWGLSTIMKTKGHTYAERRMAKIDRHSAMNHRDRALFHAYQGMDNVGKTVLSLPDAVMYSAKIKYRAFNEAVLTRGAVRDGIKANCIFQACREFGVSRTTGEIASAFGIPARDISRTFQMYQEQVPETDVHVTTPADLIPRFFNAVSTVPERMRGQVKGVITRACKDLENCVELMGRTPKAVACTVMFLKLNELGYGMTKADICKICEVSVPTLGKIESIIRTLRT